MKSDSILSKLFKFGNKSLNPGDILYYKNNNSYWLYVEDIINGNSKKLIGINAMEYMKHIKFDSNAMFKVDINNDAAIFHYKFEHDRIPSEIESDIKNGNAIKIMTLSEQELTGVKVFWYKYKNENGKES